MTAFIVQGHIYKKSTSWYTVYYNVNGSNGKYGFYI